MAGYIFGVYGAKLPKIKSFVASIGNDKCADGSSMRVGGGSISGRVLENGVPVSRRVMLYVRGNGAYAGQTRSDSNGHYTFNRTNEAMTYFIVSIDDNNDGVQYNLVGQDLISGNHDKRTAT